MVARYDYGGNCWLNNLYSLREKRYPAFVKSNFSRGGLPSQRTENTNNLLKRRSRATADLCDFYNILCGVVSEWRDKKNDENHKCSNDSMEMVFPSISLLKNVTSICTIEVYQLFEKEFLKGALYDQSELQSDTSDRAFRVSSPTNLEGDRSTKVAP
ncbi:hypothetical protein Cgig2_023819 [Carnegiea gigantea]|uniref:Protein FAR1-RELATED SEQUENCE n=1 Tax=Carnegiea gigantea TaxID=171969 RepID=A0A9Q1JY09_9CARY|nr:hypothetical protein Cgig2_023819 [Carnegiea gigantea]